MVKQKDGMRRKHPYLLYIFCLCGLLLSVSLNLWNPSKQAFAAGVSPYIFGTNLGVFNTTDQFVTSTTTQDIVKDTLHAQMIRMPVRYGPNAGPDLGLDVVIDTMEAIKNTGATPVIILRSLSKNSNALLHDTEVITEAKRIFGNQTVYYEYGNEPDFGGVPVADYIEEWNDLIPQFRALHPEAKFVGPVTGQYADGSYLQAFLEGVSANAEPDLISWHEYTCDDDDSDQECLDTIDEWTDHIADARAAMQETLGEVLDIMITEWNFNPIAEDQNDARADDPGFIVPWTEKAIQTLIANDVFASMQYAVTDQEYLRLLNPNNTLSLQGQTFKSEFERVFSSNPPTGTPVPGSPVYSFEDGTIQNWDNHGNVVSLQNSTTVGGQHGNRALKVVFYSEDAGDQPYVSVSPASGPQAGKTITASVFVPQATGTVQAKIFAMDQNFSWNNGPTVTLQANSWNALSFTLPANFQGTAENLGLQFVSSPYNSNRTIYIDAVTWN